MTEQTDAEVETLYDEEPEYNADACHEREEKDGAQEAPARTGDGGEPSGEDPLSLPPHGTQVFVGGVPRSATEDELREWAKTAGEVHSLNLVAGANDPAQNRGYGFVTYTTVEAAKNAMVKLHETCLPNHDNMPIRVQQSQSKHRLYLGGIPNSMKADKLKETLMPLLTGLEGVEVTMSWDDPSMNRGFAFLEFYNAACARASRAVLSDPEFRLGGRTVTVDTAEPGRGRAGAAAGTSPAASSRAGSQPSCNVFVGGLPASVDEAALRSAFECFGEIERVTLPRPREGASEGTRFGFVVFRTRVAAAEAVERGGEVEVAGAKVVVNYGRPDGAGGQGGRGARGGYTGPGAWQQTPGVAGSYGMGMMPGPTAGMVPLIPIQLPNGQIGYMMQPGTVLPGMGMADGGWQAGGGMQQQRRYDEGGNRGGYGSGRGGGGGGRRARGGGRPGDRGQSSRYQPY